MPLLYPIAPGAQRRTSLRQVADLGQDLVELLGREVGRVRAQRIDEALRMERKVAAGEGEPDPARAEQLYRAIENPLVLVLAKMEHVGVGVDVAELESLNRRLAEECERLVDELIERLRDEGVAKGREEAERIVAEAQRLLG